MIDLKPNLRASVCFAGVNAVEKAVWAADAADPYGSHIPATQEPRILRR